MKKLFKFLKITFFSFLALIILLFLYFFSSNKLFLGSKNQENIDYLTQSNVLMNDSINGKLFDEDFYKAKVFLLGEIHGYADNQKLDKALFQFLNKKIGVKYYIAEMDSLTAKKLNLFLSEKTKDEAKLKEVVQSIGKRIPQQSSQELFNKWSELYEYNKTLNDSMKITVIGIDTDFDKNDSKISRDSAMLVNFQHAVKNLKLENEKFYGLFGFFHVLQKNVENGKAPFAERLKKSGIATKSFVSYTLESEMYLPKNPQFPTPPDEKIDWINADGPLMLVKGINDLKKLSQQNSVTLFKLDSKNSPYFKSQNLINVKSRVFGENIIPAQNSTTTDYFQYVFLLRNSKALTKLN
ncbi:hypothetical protein ACTS95_13160 [Empedobacter brevis]